MKPDLECVLFRKSITNRSESLKIDYPREQAYGVLTDYNSVVSSGFELLLNASKPIVGSWVSL